MYIADLHIHSRYSRATSKECTPEYLDLWARKKGIHIVGTGDFTHPAWREELAEKLVPAENGLYVLKDEYRIKDGSVRGDMIPRFVITGEISSIYKKNGKVRKVHSVIILPGLEDAERISNKLEQIGNIHSDGRPILGLDCHDLLEITLELCPSSVYVPAHIWTPHFSMFGAFSGFDTVEACFGDLTPHIHAVETGLSSDPPMNWRVSALDRFQLVSNSDAHSPAKLGREANLLDIPMSYEGLAQALQAGEGLYGTIEFFPEEGKYHMDGHRKCNLCLSPSDTMKYNGICPVCGRKLTIGVSHRVEELADRPEGYVREGAKAFESLVPLPEVIAASMGCSAASKKAGKEYAHMLSGLGSEFEILRTFPIEDIRRVSGTRIAEGIRRLRDGKVERIPGFDGEYGVIRLFSADELENTEGQMSFFDMIGAAAAGEEKDSSADKTVGEEKDGSADKTVDEEKDDSSDKTGEKNAAEEKAINRKDSYVQMQSGKDQENGELLTEKYNTQTTALNPEQLRAVTSGTARIAVKAGPGTGKTKTLVSRLKYLLETRRVRPSEITAVTFTNQAAAEMRERVVRETGKRSAGRMMTIGTFHAVCLDFLKAQGREFFLAGEAELRELAERALDECGQTMSAKEFLEQVSRKKSGIADMQTGPAYDRYEQLKAEKKLYDFDDLLLCTAELIESGNVQPGWEKSFRYLLVDEFQDINPIQRRLIKIWHSFGQELFVIGDPDQSIYGFRGADAECFEKLAEDYPDLEVIGLKENYRSAPQILTAAETVMGRGERLRANCPDNVPVRVVQAAGPLAENIFIAKEIGRMAGGVGMLEAHREAWENGGRKVRGFGDIAVLYRTNHQAHLLEKCLKKEGIPYVVAGREEFLRADSVQGSICFFRYLRDEGNQAAARECARLIWKLPWNDMTEELIRNAAEKLRPSWNKKKPRKFLEEWTSEMGLEEEQAMAQLAGMTVFYRTMDEFLSALELGVESDLKRCGNKQYVSEAVTLMTLHGSKGLEFPAVFICGAEKGMIPLESEKHPADREEERRLFYVGMTRAKEELVITASGEISEFLEELKKRKEEAGGDILPDSRIRWEQAAERKAEENFRQMSLFEL